MNMPLNNREGYEEFNIRPEWYEKRNLGISAMIRCANEEKWIVDCLDSITPFFDEIVVTVGPSKDKTLDVLKRYQEERCAMLEVYEYPFSITKPDAEPDSVHDKSYYYNWTLSKTTRQIVAKWDADMIMFDNLGKLARLHKAVFKANVVRLKGYNVVETKPYYLSKLNPIEHYEPRFFRINKYMHYVQAPSFMPKPVHGRELFTYDAAGLIPHVKEWRAIDMPTWLYLYRVYNAATRKDVYWKEPAFIHTKYLKLKENPSASWAPEWEKEIQRGEKLELEQ